MKAAPSVCLLLVLLSACQHAPKAPTAAQNTYNLDAPIDYATYQRWRKENAKASEAYADYKAWLAEYHRWQAQQQKRKP